MAKNGPPIMELEETVETITMGIYGDPGVGKTVQAGTLPNNLILSTDTSGTVSAKRQGSKAKLWKIDSWDDLQAAYSWLYQGGASEFDWVTVDTGTRMRELCIRGILTKVHEENSERSEDIPAIQDHQAWQNRFIRFMDLFIALPVNILFVFHVMTIENEDGDEIRLPSLGTGKSWLAIARSVPARFSVIGFMEEKTVGVVQDGKKVGKRVRRIHWRNSPKHMAKDRYDVLGPYTDDVPLNLIADKILTEGQQAKDAPAPTSAGATPRKTAAKAAARTARKATAPAVAPDDEEDDE